MLMRFTLHYKVLFYLLLIIYHYLSHHLFSPSFLTLKYRIMSFKELFGKLMSQNLKSNSHDTFATNSEICMQ